MKVNTFSRSVFRIIMPLFLSTISLIEISSADEYDAIVTTDSGSYTVPVEVEDGEVTHVYWPNGGAMNVYGGELSDGEAFGTNSRGETVSVQVDDYTE